MMLLLTKRICNEFGIDPSTDFRFTRGANHGLGSIYIGVSGHGTTKQESLTQVLINSAMKVGQQAKGT